jgi:transposase
MRRIPRLAEIERRHVLNTLRLCGNNRTHAAKVLGLSIRGLRLKLHEYEREGLEVPPPITGPGLAHRATAPASGASIVNSSPQAS